MGGVVIHKLKERVILLMLDRKNWQKLARPYN